VVPATPPTINPITGAVISPGSPATVLPGSTNVTRTIDPNFNEGSFLGGNGFAGFGKSFLGHFTNINPFRARLQALITNGDARLLSNPRTTVLSGRTATFQVGGQVPIPSLTSNSSAGTTTGIEFKDFGVLIDVVPNATVDGVVTMRVRTEVSEPDFSIGVTPPGGGSAVPGFRRRSTVTEVTTGVGGTMALSGLIQNNVTKNVSKVPFLGNLPILGPLFTSKRFQNNETELVIFVTPNVLPNPLQPGQKSWAGVVAAGNTTNAGTELGNSGFAQFTNQTTVTAAAAGGK
jgi:pilus assembly protein CpaC